jgi:4-hydroxyphenylacetate 3-monooxygenase
MLRTGAAYLDALDDGREVYLGGRRVRSVADDPAFAGTARTVASLYDSLSSGEAVKNPPTDENGEPYNPCWLRPKTQEDLAKRRELHQAWANISYGLFGRSPDHVSSFITGMACDPQVSPSADGQFERNIVDYWRYARDRDLFVAYAIVPPGGEKGREAVVGGGRVDPNDPTRTAALRVVRETDSGVIVRGTKTLATGAVLADELLVGNILPLGPGEEDFAVTFTTPIAAPGLKVISRKAFAEHAQSSLDDPLSSRFDETDAVVFFDDVLIPWNRVFSYRDLEAGRALFYDTPAHALGNAQAHIRLLTKMSLMLAGLRAMTVEIGTVNVGPVRDVVASMVVRVAMLDAMVKAEEINPHHWPSGFVSHDLQALYATMAWSAEYYTEFVLGIREMMGSHIFQQPADASAFDDEVTSKLLMDALHVGRSVDDARYRYKLIKLLWDLVGSEFASRHIQYEMFYAGPKHVTRGRSAHFFRWDQADRLLERALAETGNDAAADGSQNGLQADSGHTTIESGVAR